ncbi:MAG: S-adenosylmethionine:tRNA ribosyltransferase-isomerase [Bacteroidales bacterium]|nr:S-adenosylmethionine:tRNA ribosyltransferase-isomerase [Bacteroidales bacterium]
MKAPKQITIDDYDYHLPTDRIAKFPLENRDESKLLVYRDGVFEESVFNLVVNHLDKDTLLVFNNTKVIHARLFFRKETGSQIEIFCLEPYQMAISIVFEQRQRCTWMCFVGNNKRWKNSPLYRTIEVDGKEVTLSATRKEAVANTWIIDFEWDNSAMTFAEVIERFGVIPLPPYLNRSAEDSDKERYQTVYAEHEGSVAAPTAGLHFTQSVFDNLRKKGINTEFITLHVGAGTFKPVDSETIGEHEMHVERIEILRSNVEHLLSHVGKPIIPVGTTSVRTLESLYWFGVKLQFNPSLEEMHILQWEPYELTDKGEVPLEQSLKNVLAFMHRLGVDKLYGDTQLMIAPGYKYHVVSGIITNFHQPKSTLLLLVSALIGNVWKEGYSYALNHGFRFLSYGDSCLFLP